MQEQVKGTTPQVLATDEIDSPRQPSRMEIYQAEVRECNRIAKAEQEKKRAQRKRAKTGRKNNRKRK